MGDYLEITAEGKMDLHHQHQLEGKVMKIIDKGGENKNFRHQK